MSILYIVATPIGNLNDISTHAIETLKSVDFIACEDTRHTKQLLSHFGISTPTFSYHEHNEQKSADKIIQCLQEKKSIALVSDAGTPLISDPGYAIVSRAHELNITLSPIPGPCAAIAALSVSGLPSDKFIFEGFLPAKTGTRQHRLLELATESRTLIFYEAPHRILETVQDIIIIFGGAREITICRELTKTFETIYKSTTKNVLKWLEENSNHQKGEFVLVVAGISDDEKETLNQQQAQQLVKKLITDLPLKKSVHIAAELFHVSKNTLYDWALTLKR
ncbi:MAG: 16S rRNA (cytidine(1402)-2'-O)-methyltransferase [Gammaproteobacteria bacterium]|nr:16S rRNA (cytidine(1402)-2'-O)-methyltransferase [Gammaproteobacteria bacterium]